MPTALESARKLKSRLAAITMNRLGLRYVSTDELTIRRKRVGESFTFVSARGRTIRDELTRARLRKRSEDRRVGKECRSRWRSSDGGGDARAPTRATSR